MFWRRKGLNRMFWRRKGLSKGSRRTLWLVKDDPEGKWFCTCLRGVVDVPWHSRETDPTGGTGWLFTCLWCKQAFMFARAVRIRSTLEELGARGAPRRQRVMNGKTGEITESVLIPTVEAWLEEARLLLEGVIEGERYVFLDGRVLPAVHGPVAFDGLWRRHDLKDLPHLDDADELLADPDYWFGKR